ncbi:putative bifunctional diguanylate cyclase/phosphodiesterase, partial [Eisenbergiella massiliensis]
LDGDEFGIIILNGEEEDYLRIFNSIQHKFHGQQEYNGKKYYCTVSGGYAVYPTDADNYLDLLKCANYSLEHSKLEGKDRITRFSEDILKEKERKLELAELLRESIDRGFAGFSISYQPQVESETGTLYGAEALARWRCAKYGNVSPGEFIPLLEQSGLIVPLGSWVLYHAVEQCRKWCELKPDFHMSINLSYRQLLEGDIVANIQETLEALHVQPGNVTLELTETYLIKEDAGTRDILEKMKKMGINLAMDDFGIGYSSLFSLKNIPVDIVKIDRGFVKGITSDLFNATFVRAITELCHDVGKKVCLEGVETKEEYDVVKNSGLELIQGFYFGYPINAEMFEKQWL